MFVRECAKCNGQGNIRAFSNVDGGRCFSCAGRGTISTKAAPKASARFAVSAQPKAGGDLEVVFTVKARHEAEALKVAIAQLQRGNAYIPESARVALA